MKRFFLFIIPTFIILSCSNSETEKTTDSSAKTLPDNFFLTKLSNGLEVLVIEDPNVPLATIEICVHNGSYTEPDKYDGLSHLYEHMFFKANETYPSQEAFMKRTQELGIVFNGTTSEERVNYFFTLGKDKLEAGIEFMNAAITGPLFLEEEMKKENPVVDGEFQRNESSPYFFLFDAMKRALWGDLYSRKNVIGNHDTILMATPEKMREIQSRYYYPNNSILAVAGDVQHDDVFQLAEKHLSDWKSSDFDPFKKYPIPEFEPITENRKTLVENENIRVPMFIFGFHGPDTRNDIPATYAADVLSFILSQKSSKLQKELVESGLAYQVGVNYQTLKHVGPIQIMVVPKPDKIQEVLTKIKEHMSAWTSPDYYTDEQMQTAKDLLEIQDAYGSEKTSEYIHTVTYWWASASIDYYTNYVKNIQAVTRADINKYITQYIQNNHYVLGGIIHPAHKEQVNVDSILQEML